MEILSSESSGGSSHGRFNQRDVPKALTPAFMFDGILMNSQNIVEIQEEDLLHSAKCFNISG